MLPDPHPALSNERPRQRTLGSRRWRFLLPCASRDQNRRDGEGSCINNSNRSENEFGAASRTRLCAWVQRRRRDHDPRESSQTLGERRGPHLLYSSSRFRRKQTTPGKLSEVESLIWSDAKCFVFARPTSARFSRASAAARGVWSVACDAT